MAKVLVRATEDFFDRENQQIRKKGGEFVIHDRYAETLGKRVRKIGETVGMPRPVVIKKTGTPKDMDSRSIKKAAKKK